MQACDAESVVVGAIHHVVGEDEVADGGVDGGGGEVFDAVRAQDQGAGVRIKRSAFL